MLHPQANELYERLLKSPEFIQLCKEACRQAANPKSISYNEIRRQLSHIVSSYQEFLSTTEYRQFFQRAYVALMKVVSQQQEHFHQARHPAPSASSSYPGYEQHYSGSQQQLFPTQAHQGHSHEVDIFQTLYSPKQPNAIFPLNDPPPLRPTQPIPIPPPSAYAPPHHQTPPPPAPQQPQTFTKTQPSDAFTEAEERLLATIFSSSLDSQEQVNTNLFHPDDALLPDTPEKEVEGADYRYSSIEIALAEPVAPPPPENPSIISFQDLEKASLDDLFDFPQTHETPTQEDQESLPIELSPPQSRNHQSSQNHQNINPSAQYQQFSGGLPFGMLSSPSQPHLTSSSQMIRQPTAPDLSVLSNPGGNSRFETISFPDGFYLLDRLTGASWFIAAGSHQFIACQFETAPPPTHTPLPLPKEASQDFHAPLPPPKPKTPIPSPSTPASSASLDDVLPQELFPTLVPPKYLADSPKKPSNSYPSHASLPLDQDILQGYPYPIARLYDAFLVENDPRIRLRLLMLVFTLTLKYTSFPLILKYLHSTEHNDLQTFQALQRIQSSQLSSWLEFIGNAYSMFVDSPPPFTQEILDVYRRLESERPLQERFLYTQRFLDPLGKERSNHLRLGLFEALIVYRDSFVHGFNPTLEQAQEDLAVYEPVLREILQEMNWMTRYPLLYTFRQQEDGSYLTYPLMGMYPQQEEADPIEIPPHDLSTNHPLFLYHPPTQQTLPLAPLLITALPLVDDSPIPSQRHALFFFHDSTGQQLNYHNLWHYPYSTNEHMPLWRRLLNDKYYPYPQQNPSHDQLFLHTDFWSRRTLDNLIHSQQYLPELTIPRRNPQRTLLDFYASRSLCLLLLGATGIGKTSLLAAETEIRLSQQQLTLLFQGPDFYEIELLELLSRTLGIPLAPTQNKQLQVLEAALSEISASQPLLLFFDGVDDHPEPESFFKQLDAFLVLLSKSTLNERIKLVVSMRSDTYTLLQHNNPLFPQSRPLFFSFENSRIGFKEANIELELPPFQIDELEVAYQQYRDFRSSHEIAPFCPHTTWYQLSPESRTRNLLRHPLLLRLSLATFCQQDLPPDLTVTQLLQKFLEQVIEEKHSPLPVPERLQFLHAQMKLTLEKRTNSITRDQLYYSEHSQLSRSLQNPHTDSPYIQLLHLGILSEDWRTDNCWIRFTSDMLFQFFFTQAYLQAHVDHPLDALPPALEQAPSTTYFFLWLHILQHEPSSALTQWLQEQQVTPLLREFFLRLCQIDDPQWPTFLQALLEMLDEGLCDDLIATTDRLLQTGYDEVAYVILQMLKQKLPSSPANHSQRHLEIDFRIARIAEFQGDPEQALELYEECQKHAQNDEHNDLLAHTLLRVATIFRHQGEYDLAHQALKDLLHTLEQTENPSLQARVLRQKGNLFYEQGDLEQALHSYQESLKLDEANEYPRGIAASHSNLGTVLGSQGELDLALDHYHRCLRIQQTLGDRKNVATTLNNIGIILKNQSKTAQALQHFQRSLALREEIGNFREIVISHNNIALLLQQQGDFIGALEHQKQSLLLKNHLQDSRGLVNSLQKIGELLYHIGEFDEALQHYQQASELCEQQEDFKSQAAILASIGQIWEERGNLDEALPYYQEAREFYESEQDLAALAIILRSVGRIKAQQKQLDQALQELHQALALAENTGQRQEVLHCMLELAQVRLMRGELPATRAYIDRTLSLSEELDEIFPRKDALCLLVRVAIRVENWLEVEENLQQLEQILEQINFDPTAQHTVWALFEAAKFYQDLDQIRALNLCEFALLRLAGRFFPKRRELEELHTELQNAPHSPHPMRTP